MPMRPWRRRINAALAERFRSEGAWPDRCVHEYLADAAAQFPDRLAVSDAVWRLTFAELAEASATVAAGLSERSIGKDSLVGVQTANEVEFLVAHYALASVGAVTISLPISIGPRDAVQLLTYAGADALILEARRASELIDRFDPSFPVWAYHHTGGGEAPLIADLGGTGRAALQGDPDADYIMMPTAGTTGLPKLAVRSHNAWLAMARKKLATFEALHLSQDDCVLVLSPVNQGVGYIHGFVSPHLVPGWRRVLLERFEPEQALALVERESVTMVAGVPAHAIQMFRHPELDSYDLSSLKVIQCGGDAFSPDVRASVEDRLGVPVILDYGASDVGCACGPRPEDPVEKRRVTVGRPMPWTNVSARDDRGEEVPAGEEGEIWIDGPDMISGYYPDDTGAYDIDRGCPTGDIGHFDPDGYLIVSGRKKDLIIRGGLNISPGEVEAAVRLHPDITEAAAVGTPDDVLGERICVFAVSASKPEPTLEEVLERLAAAGVAKAMWPERLVFVPELPLSPGGKVQKSALRKWLSEEAESRLGP